MIGARRGSSFAQGAAIPVDRRKAGQDSKRFPGVHQWLGVTGGIDPHGGSNRFAHAPGGWATFPQESRPELLKQEPIEVIDAEWGFHLTCERGSPIFDDLFCHAVRQAQRRRQ